MLHVYDRPHVQIGIHIHLEEEAESGSEAIKHHNQL